jgi:predicted nuclease of restriction endonuclease-like RecB superfamily
MSNVVDQLYSEPEEVREFIFQALEKQKHDPRLSAMSMMRERLGDRYTESQLSTLWYAASWVMR